MSAPLFQHRHYVAIASTIAGMRDAGMSSEMQTGVDILRQRLATMFANDNPRFDRERFLSAAMGNPCNGRDKVRS